MPRQKPNGQADQLKRIIVKTNQDLIGLMQTLKNAPANTHYLWVKACNEHPKPHNSTLLAILQHLFSKNHMPDARRITLLAEIFTQLIQMNVDTTITNNSGALALDVLMQLAGNENNLDQHLGLFETECQKNAFLNAIEKIKNTLQDKTRHQIKNKAIRYLCGESEFGACPENITEQFAAQGNRSLTIQTTLDDSKHTFYITKIMGCPKASFRFFPNRQQFKHEVLELPSHINPEPLKRPAKEQSFTDLRTWDELSYLKSYKALTLLRKCENQLYLHIFCSTKPELIRMMLTHCQDQKKPWLLIDNNPIKQINLIFPEAHGSEMKTMLTQFHTEHEALLSDAPETLEALLAEMKMG